MTTSYYLEYLQKKLPFAEIEKERKRCLTNLSDIRDRDVIVYAANFKKPSAIVSDDFYFIKELLPKTGRDNLDVILETPGGLAEVVEDIVDLIRSEYKEFAVFVPGRAKSAGTIFAMAADDIYMSKTSSLGPIDAQVQINNKFISADAVLHGFEKIKKEVGRFNRLNQAYIPILQGLSPGELQDYENAQAFSKTLVRDWLVKYKFKNWNVRKTSGKKVTQQIKQQRADSIAKKLQNSKMWHRHSRSLNIHKLREMKLIIEDYTNNAQYQEYVDRYYALLFLTFQLSPNLIKIFETSNSQFVLADNPVNTIKNK